MAITVPFLWGFEKIFQVITCPCTFMIGYRPYRPWHHLDSDFALNGCTSHDVEYVFVHLMTGWWYTYPSEKWWTSSVGMDGTSQYMESQKIHVPNHQPVAYLSGWLPKKTHRWIPYGKTQQITRLSNCFGWKGEKADVWTIPSHSWFMTLFSPHD